MSSENIEKELNNSSNINLKKEEKNELVEISLGLNLFNSLNYF